MKAGLCAARFLLLPLLLLLRLMCRFSIILRHIFRQRVAARAVFAARGLIFLFPFLQVRQRHDMRHAAWRANCC